MADVNLSLPSHSLSSGSSECVVRCGVWGGRDWRYSGSCALYQVWPDMQMMVSDQAWVKLQSFWLEEKKPLRLAAFPISSSAEECLQLEEPSENTIGKQAPYQDSLCMPAIRNPQVGLWCCCHKGSAMELSFSFCSKRAVGCIPARISAPRLV